MSVLNFCSQVLPFVRLFYAEWWEFVLGQSDQNFIPERSRCPLLFADPSSSSSYPVGQQCHHRYHPLYHRLHRCQRWNEQIWTLQQSKFNYLSFCRQIFEWAPKLDATSLTCIYSTPIVMMLGRRLARKRPIGRNQVKAFKNSSNFESLQSKIKLRNFSS